MRAYSAAEAPDSSPIYSTRLTMRLETFRRIVERQAWIAPDATVEEISQLPGLNDQGQGAAHRLRHAAAGKASSFCSMILARRTWRLILGRC
jgi:hypothetical protein